jgi:hypothetical protein
MVRFFHGFFLRKEPKRFKLHQAKVGSASHNFFSFLHFLTQASMVQCFYEFFLRKEPKRFKLHQAKVGSASHNLFFIPSLKQAWFSIWNEKSPILSHRTFACAHDWIRTSTPNGTTPSRWHVYQFHHVGKAVQR